MIATVLGLISGNLLEVIGGAAGFLGLIVGVMFGGRGKKAMVSDHKAKEATLKADMLERENTILREVRNEKDADLAARISNSE